MIISIASGKGGTGKTTIAANLAYSLGNEAHILDCDVEEPNAHLFLKPELKHLNSVSVSTPQIDKTRCSLCSLCAEICQFNAIVLVGENIITFPKMCHSCGGCKLVCREKAIFDQPRQIGQIRSDEAKQQSFTDGILDVGEAMAPPLIKMVKHQIQPDKINVIDAPPGTSCPVITAVTGTDYVVLVTEPTPFGLHDLKLAVAAIEQLKIPYGLIINRSDIGNSDVKNFATDKRIPILLEIPFLRSIAEIYSRGALFAEVLPEWKVRLTSIVTKIQKQIQGGLKL